jgi:hypothetical protein
MTFSILNPIYRQFLKRARIFLNLIIVVLAH